MKERYWFDSAQVSGLLIAIIAAARAACPRGFAITAKLRVQYCERGTRPSTERTVEFARRLVAAGADLIALHARVRGSPEQRRAGAADLTVVRALVDAGLGVPILSNGNVRSREDVALNLRATGADGVSVPFCSNGAWNTSVWKVELTRNDKGKLCCRVVGANDASHLDHEAQRRARAVLGGPVHGARRQLAALEYQACKCSN